MGGHTHRQSSLSIRGRWERRELQAPSLRALPPLQAQAFSSTVALFTVALFAGLTSPSLLVGTSPPLHWGALTRVGPSGSLKLEIPSLAQPPKSPPPHQLSPAKSAGAQGWESGAGASTPTPPLQGWLEPSHMLTFVPMNTRPLLRCLLAAYISCFQVEQTLRERN